MACACLNPGLPSSLVLIPIIIVLFFPRLGRHAYTYPYQPTHLGLYPPCKPALERRVWCSVGGSVLHAASPPNLLSLPLPPCSLKACIPSACVLLVIVLLFCYWWRHNFVLAELAEPFFQDLLPHASSILCCAKKQFISATATSSRQPATKCTL